MVLAIFRVVKYIWVLCTSIYGCTEPNHTALICVSIPSNVPSYAQDPLSPELDQSASNLSPSGLQWCLANCDQPMTTYLSLKQACFVRLGLCHVSESQEVDDFKNLNVLNSQYFCSCDSTTSHSYTTRSFSAQDKHISYRHIFKWVALL